jgi:hypothetical protein
MNKLINTAIVNNKNVLQKLHNLNAERRQKQKNSFSPVIK